MMSPQRHRLLNHYSYQGGAVVYWLSREQRARDNWALLYGQQLALDHRAPLAVVFNLAPRFLGAAHRQYDFMLRGLAETAARLKRRGIPFFLLRGEPGDTLPAFLEQCRAGALVTDFDPLRLKRQWKNQVLEGIQIPVIEVDAHNIVPCWLASPKLEFAAYTLRPKIHRLLPEFLTDLPALQDHPFSWAESAPAIDWGRALAGAAADVSVPPVDWLRPGEDAARESLRAFLGIAQNSDRFTPHPNVLSSRGEGKINDKTFGKQSIRRGLQYYDRDRNDPTLSGQSDLSPYLHFGQIAPQRVAWEVQRADAPPEDKKAFLEELIVRRELSDNFCFYNPDYDKFSGFPEWAQKTLNLHRSDPREYVYSLEEFEQGRTHEDLWNAAQLEMVRRGKMHGYLRMYWAKKILEWTASPEEALETAIYLNDRYELDGRDPNGYVGAVWSIGGVHDRAWGERPIFGKIRYMSLAGCRRKFKVDQYIRAILENNFA